MEETMIDQVLAYLMAAITATAVALSLGYVARYDLGLCRQEIRTSASNRVSLNN
jgi:hypothetical protein